MTPYLFSFAFRTGFGHRIVKVSNLTEKALVKIRERIAADAKPPLLPEEVIFISITQLDPD